MTEEKMVTHAEAHEALVQVNSYPECTARLAAVRVVQRYIRQTRERELRQDEELSALLARLGESADAVARDTAAARVDLDHVLAEAWRLRKPVDAELFCPACGLQHLDVGEFRTRVHRKHLCDTTPLGPHTGCGHLWVPHEYPTRGVVSRRLRVVYALERAALVLQRGVKPTAVAYCYWRLLGASTLAEALCFAFATLYCAWSVAYWWSEQRDRERV